MSAEFEEKAFLTQLKRNKATGQYDKSVVVKGSVDEATAAFHAYFNAYGYGARDGESDETDLVECFVMNLGGAIKESELWDRNPEEEDVGPFFMADIRRIAETGEFAKGISKKATLEEAIRALHGHMGMYGYGARDGKSDATDYCAAYVFDTKKTCRKSCVWDAIPRPEPPAPEPTPGPTPDPDEGGEDEPESNG